jgi:hypothetical protein
LFPTKTVFLRSKALILVGIRQNAKNLQEMKSLNVLDIFSYIMCI